jgi:hypothetical protein
VTTFLDYYYRAITGLSPSGSAGGALDGTFPNPGLAASVAGAGLAETSDVLSVNVDGSTLEINSDSLRVKDGGITSAKITDGTITTSDLAFTPYTSGGTDVAVADGGTGASSASAARTNLGLVIGTDVEAHDADLTTIAGLSPTNDDVIQRKAGAWANRTIAQLLVDLAAVGTTFQPLDSDLTAIAALSTTTFGRSLLALADAAAARTALSLVPGTDVQAFDAELAALAGLTSAANKLPYFTGSGTAALADLSAFARTFLDDADAATVRATLGVTGSGSGGAGWDVTITKASDESVTGSTTLQDDDELFFTTASGGVYLIELLIVYASPLGTGTTDIRSAFGEDATARGSFHAIMMDPSNVASTAAVLSNQTGTFGSGTAAANRLAIFRGWHTGNGGTFKYQWTQNTSQPQASIVRAGSILRYSRVV